MRRVAITGMGAVSCIGLDAATAWASMTEGRGGIGPITGIEGAVTQPIAGQLRGLDLARHFDPKRGAVLDRVSALALVAAREAMHQAGFVSRNCDAARTAVVIGTGVGGEGS